MKALVISAVFLMTATAFAASDVTQIPSPTQTQSDNSVTNDTSYPSVSGKAKTIYSSSNSVVSRIIPTFGIVDSDLVGGGSSDINTTKIGIEVGALMDLGHSDTVLETGLLYRQLGISASAGGASAQLNLNYLAIPIGAKYYFNGQEDTSLFIKGGVMPQILVSSSASLSDGQGDSLSSSSTGANTFDLDLYAGVGTKFGVGDRTDLLIDLSYARGVTNVSPSGSSTLNNSAFVLSAGVGFDL